MPTDAPHLARQAAPIAQLMSPVLWLANKPDRFDSYSAGAALQQSFGALRHLPRNYSIIICCPFDLSSSCFASDRNSAGTEG